MNLLHTSTTPSQFETWLEVEVNNSDTETETNRGSKSQIIQVSLY